MSSNIILYCLCNSECKTITRYKNWRDKEQIFIQQHYGQVLSPESKLCKRHQLEAMRYHSKADYVPKWKKVHKSLVVNVA